ncbi:MAG: serine/threonine protein phosphatase [Thermodesulfobacteria bacterium]|nr:serine/threonine protein phosphatase [Thermodesulfobacteriota bacterium]
MSGVRDFLKINKDSKIFAIGDIHGCIDSLESLLAILPVKWGKDFVIFLGDYIDRGPNPRKVIEKVIELKNKFPDRVFTLKGNHEQMFERFLLGYDISTFLYNGGSATLRCYYTKGMLEIPGEHLKFLKELKLIIETEEYIFVHGGINPEKPLEEQTEDDVLWIRGSFYHYPGRFEKTVVFGHTPFSEPFVKEDRIGIDTGCVYGGKLTAVMLPDREFFQVNC